METYKIITLQKMLEQENLNLERLKGDTNNPCYKQSEANIKKLREQLRLVGAEVKIVSISFLFFKFCLCKKWFLTFYFLFKFLSTFCPVFLLTLSVEFFF